MLPTASDQTFLAKYQQPLILVGVFAVLVILFLFAPWTGDDWKLFYRAVTRMRDGEPLYVYENQFYNPAWMALIFVPFTWVPAEFGYAVLSAATIFALAALLIHWQPEAGVIKLLLALLSPPTIYIFIHGQVDAILIALVLLPSEWWVLVALTKPQVTIGLGAGIPPSRWLRAALVTAGVCLITFVLIGFWVDDLINIPHTQSNAALNLWGSLWPYQVPLGVGLIAVGWSHKNERLLIAGSPFLAPYAAMSSLIGPWLVALTYLKTWQAALVWLSWWGAVVYRGLA